MKVHLEGIDGLIHCGVNNGANYKDENLKRTKTIEKVTCLRCKRRYYRYPINSVVKGIL